MGASDRLVAVPEHDGSASGFRSGEPGSAATDSRHMSSASGGHHESVLGCESGCASKLCAGGEDAGASAG